MARKKRYVKLHFAVNTLTHEVLSMEVSTDDVHDSKLAACLISGAGSRAKIEGGLGDGAYDSSEIYEELEKRGIEAVNRAEGER